MSKMNYREMGMDTMERLYYRDQEDRNKAYSNKKSHKEHKGSKKAKKADLAKKRKQMQEDSDLFVAELDQFLKYGV